MAYTDLYKKSIFFEILSVDSNGQPLVTVESFAFTIPPSSLEIVQTQRVTKTATPGGFFIDNYGMGSANITISGETGNEEKRLSILGPGKTPRSLTGQECFFYFRDKIARYSQKNQNYVMRFYDLTHKGGKNIFNRLSFGGNSQFSEAWEVVLDESAMRRTSAKPFFYPYTINLTGLRPLGTYNSGAVGKVIGFLSDIKNKIDAVVAAIEEFKTNITFLLDNAFEFVSDVASILTSVNSFVSQLTSFTGLVLEYEKKLGGLFDDVISETSQFISSGLQLISFPYDVLETARLEALDVVDKTNQLISSAKTAGKNVLNKYDWTENIDPVSNIGLSLIAIEEKFNVIVLLAKQDSSFEPIGGIILNGIVTPVYGQVSYVVQENTRLDKLARDIYGDPDLKDVIAGINGIYSNDELTASTILSLPILSPDIRYANNAVYNTPDNRNDVLGKDAHVVEGVFDLNSEDYAITAGEGTILQAISFRLTEKKGRQIRDGSYGIVAQIGTALNSDAPFEYLSVSLAETLIQDPRITAVYGLNFLGDGDKLYQEFKVDTLSKPAITYREGL